MPRALKRTKLVIGQHSNQESLGRAVDYTGDYLQATCAALA